MYLCALMIQFTCKQDTIKSLAKDISTISTQTYSQLAVHIGTTEMPTPTPGCISSSTQGALQTLGRRVWG